MKTTLLCLLLGAGVLAARAGAAEPAIIAKARAWLGTDEALDRVHAIHLSGSMTTQLEGDDKTRKTAKLDIVFQKPYEESITSISADVIQRRVLDGYNGWVLDQPLAPGEPATFDPHKPQSLSILGVNQVRMLRADTWENLYFYRGIERADGEILDQGQATLDGIDCEKVELRHSDTIAYTRYFDRQTGRLVFTKTYAGAEIREDGVIEADGVKFPRSITLQEANHGKLQKTVITFDQVTVNEDRPESYFATPPPPLPIDRPIATAPPPPRAAAADGPAAAQAPRAPSQP